MNFDKIIERPIGGGKLTYGIVQGGNTVFFIKVGLGGSIYGYENNYLRIARRLCKTYGYTVIVADDPYDVDDQPEDAMGFLTSLFGAEEYTVLFMGVSNGAVLGAQYGWRYPRIRRMLLVNGPLMINWHRTEEGLRKFKGDKAVMIYGDRDPSFRYCELLDVIENPAVTHEIIPGADHHFAGMPEAFDALPERIIL